MRPRSFLKFLAKIASVDHSYWGDNEVVGFNTKDRQVFYTCFNVIKKSKTSIQFEIHFTDSIILNFDVELLATPKYKLSKGTWSGVLFDFFDNCPDFICICTNTSPIQLN